MRQLTWMAEGKGRHDWGQTSLLAMIGHNLHCAAGKQRPLSDFTPFPNRTRREPDFVLDGKEGMNMLRKVFGNGR